MGHENPDRGTDNRFDLEIENILERNTTRKKGVNSKSKGDRGERLLCKRLSERFGGKPFERSLGSGNRWGQVKSLPQHAKDTLLGDICCPEGFRFVLESKCGYEDKVDFYSLFIGGSRQLDEFFAQAEAECGRAGRPPILLYKRSRRPWLAFLRNCDLKGDYPFRLVYREWTGVALEELLKLPDTFFFSGS